MGHSIFLSLNLESFYFFGQLKFVPGQASLSKKYLCTPRGGGVVNRVYIGNHQIFMSSSATDLVPSVRSVHREFKIRNCNRQLCKRWRARCGLTFM